MKLNYRWSPGWSLYIHSPAPTFTLCVQSVLTKHRQNRQLSRSQKLYWSKDQTEISCILSKNSLPRSVKVKVVICNGSEADLGNIYYETKGELSNRAAWHHLTLFLKKFFLRIYPYFKVLRGIMGLLPKATQHRVNINCRDVLIPTRFENGNGGKTLNESVADDAIIGY